MNDETKPLTKTITTTVVFSVSELKGQIETIDTQIASLTQIKSDLIDQINKAITDNKLNIQPVTALQETNVSVSSL